MNTSLDQYLEYRLEQIENVLASAAAGNLESEITLNSKFADELTSIEAGINLIISDLRSEVAEREKLKALLNAIGES